VLQPNIAAARCSALLSVPFDFPRAKQQQPPSCEATAKLGKRVAESWAICVTSTVQKTMLGGYAVKAEKLSPIKVCYYSTVHNRSIQSYWVTWRICAT
jgi:hypothetical protein